MPYTVSIIPKSGDKATYTCGGATDQEALVYAGKVVEENAADADPSATVVIEKDGERIGPPATIADMTKRAV